MKANETAMALLVFVSLLLTINIWTFYDFYIDGDKGQRSPPWEDYEKKCLEQSSKFMYAYGEGPDIYLSQVNESCIIKKDNFTNIDSGVYYHINISCFDKGKMVYHLKKGCETWGYVK